MPRPRPDHATPGRRRFVLATSLALGALDAVRNDAGIVFVPNRPFAIAVMTTFGRDASEAEISIARIARAAWSYFDPVGKSSALGRIVR
jgi:hypothetical protein